MGYNLFNRYEAYEDWYVDFGSHSALSVSRFAAPYLGNDTTDTRCHSGFVSSMAGMLWVAFAVKFRSATFSQYQCKLPSAYYEGWWCTQQLRDLHMVGKNSAGLRTEFPYQRDNMLIARFGVAG